MQVKIVKLSICDCGFPVLSEQIGLGEIYEIDEANTMNGFLICGGCFKKTQCVCVMTEKKGESEAGYLPREIFSN